MSLLVCGQSTCPAGYYPAGYSFMTSTHGCPNGSFPYSITETECKPACGTFATCNVGACPAGWHIIAYSPPLAAPQCGDNAGSLSSGAAVCEQDCPTGSFWQCGMGCPAGYHMSGKGWRNECNPVFFSAPSNLDATNMVTCEPNPASGSYWTCMGAVGQCASGWHPDYTTVGHAPQCGGAPTDGNIIQCLGN